MTSASLPERGGFLGVRGRRSEPPTHAISIGGSETMCGISIEGSDDVVLSLGPFMSTFAVAEMLAARVPPCEICRTAVEATEGPPGEL